MPMTVHSFVGARQPTPAASVTLPHRRSLEALTPSLSLTRRTSCEAVVQGGVQTSQLSLTGMTGLRQLGSCASLNARAAFPDMSVIVNGRSDAALCDEKSGNTASFLPPILTSVSAPKAEKKKGLFSRLF